MERYLSAKHITVLTTSLSTKILMSLKSFVSRFLANEMLILLYSWNIIQNLGSVTLALRFADIAK